MKRMGNITEVRYMKGIPECSIQELGKDSYVIPSTDELKEFEHTEIRTENLTSTSRSLTNLRDLFNTSITDTSRCLWVTPTYKENTQGNKRLYRDFRKLHMRMLHYLKKHSLPTCEYVVAMESQDRDAWRAHLVMIFPCKAPFTPNDTLVGIWGHGSIKTEPLKNMDNAGLYLTAHLVDTELPDVISSHGKIYGSLEAVSVTNEQDNRQTKAIMKGIRLKLYPSGSRIYKTGRGARKPEVINCTETEAIEEVENAPLTFKWVIKTIDDSGKDFSIINYR